MYLLLIFLPWTEIYMVETSSMVDLLGHYLEFYFREYQNINVYPYVHS